mgnify:FL=1
MKMIKEYWHKTYKLWMFFVKVWMKTERVKDCKSAQEIWRKLEEFYENKNFNFSEEKEENSTLNSNEEENRDDLIVEKIVKRLYEKLKRANELNKILKSQLNERALEKIQIRKENVNLKLTINELNESYKEVDNTNKELKKNEKLNEK